MSYGEVSIVQLQQPDYYPYSPLASETEYGTVYDAAAANVFANRYGISSADHNAICGKIRSFIPVTHFAFDEADIQLLDNGGCRRIGSFAAGTDACTMVNGLRDFVRNENIDNGVDMYIGLTGVFTTTRGCQYNGGPTDPYPSSADVPSRYAIASVSFSHYGEDLPRGGSFYEHAVALVWMHELAHIFNLPDHDVDAGTCRYRGTLGQYPEESTPENPASTVMGAADARRPLTAQYCPQFDFPVDDIDGLSYEDDESSTAQRVSFNYFLDNLHWW